MGVWLRPTQSATCLEPLIHRYVMTNGSRSGDDMENDNPIQISADCTLDGTSPVVLIGPNGAGKTRHAAKMLAWNEADMIAARRILELPSSVKMEALEEASNRLHSAQSQRKSAPWSSSNDVAGLFSKLLAEEAVTASQLLREVYRDGPKAARPEPTKIMLLQEVWGRLFPGRTIDFSGYKLAVHADHGDGENQFPAQQMSDGERVALYLAGRVLESGKRIIIIDEPEVHLHSRLAARFWDEMQALRPDLRFVYLTHNLNFALSREGAVLAGVMPNSAPQVISVDEGLPRRLTEALLAGATFSLHAERIVFCEGQEGASPDQRLYSSWFRGPGTVVVPVGSGKDVVRCTMAFSTSSLISGLCAEGIVDRDYWPKAYLQSLPESVQVLPVHEVENLFCIRDVFVAVAEHLGKPESGKLYDEFIGDAAARFKDGVLAKQVSERFRRRYEHQVRSALNALKVSDDIRETRNQHTEALDPAKWASGPASVFDEERKIIDAALAEKSTLFLRYLPGKVFFPLAAKSLGIGQKEYVGLICSALRAEPGHQLAELGAQLAACLDKFLPPRSITSAQRVESNSST